MSFELVKNYLTERGYGDRAREFTVSSATVELAAAALGCEGARIAKTLSFKTPEGVVLIVAAGDAKVDNHKYKEKFHTKARMLTPEEAVELVGHAVGGVCPFCVKEGVKVYLDPSLRRFDIVYPACGSPNSAVKLTPEELELLSGGEWCDLCSFLSLRQNKNMGSFPRVTADPGDFLKTGDGFSVEKSSGPAQKMVF